MAAESLALYLLTLLCTLAELAVRFSKPSRSADRSWSIGALTVGTMGCGGTKLELAGTGATMVDPFARPLGDVTDVTDTATDSVATISSVGPLGASAS